MTAVNTNNQAVNRKAEKTISSLDNIKKDMSVLKTDIVELGRTVQSEGLKKIEAATSELQDKIDDLKTQGAGEYDKIQAYVKANPTQSVAIAFAAGALLTYIAGRK